MKPPLRLWTISIGISASFHAAVLGAVALYVGGPLRMPPRVELPAGEALGVRVILVSIEDAEESQLEQAPQIDAIQNDVMESIELAEQAIDAQSDPTNPAEADMHVALDMESPSPLPSASELEMSVRTAEPMAPIEVQATSDTHVLAQLIDLGRANMSESVRSVQEAINRAQAFVESANQAIAKLPHVFSQPSMAASKPTSGGAPGVIEGPSPSHSNKPPKYPESARKQRQSGTVMLHLEITAEGHVAAVKVINSSGFESLDHAASTAIETWRFTPATELGAAVACEIDLPVQFVLR